MANIIENFLHRVEFGITKDEALAVEQGASFPAVTPSENLNLLAQKLKNKPRIDNSFMQALAAMTDGDLREYNELRQEIYGSAELKM